MSTNAFPFFFFTTVITTNWVAIPGDSLREGRTNYIHEIEVIETNVYAMEVKLCTNPSILHTSQSSPTNSPKRWRALPIMPGTPGKL